MRRRRQSRPAFESIFPSYEEIHGLQMLAAGSPYLKPLAKLLLWPAPRLARAAFLPKPCQ